MKSPAQQILIRKLGGCLVILCLLLTGACSWNRGSWGDDFRDQDVQMVKKGLTRGEVVKILGAPDRIVEVNGHEILQYYKYELRTMAFVPLLVGMSRAYIVSDDLYVFLNKDALVDDVIFGRRTNRQEYQFWPWGN